MGGSGSSNGRPVSGSGGSSGSDKCDLRFQTELFSPVAAVIDELDKGDRLDVELYTENQTTSVAALTKGNRSVAGTITGAGQLGDLIRCLRGGQQYEAEIVKISGSSVTVIIERI